MLLQSVEPTYNINVIYKYHVYKGTGTPYTSINVLTEALRLPLCTP